MRREMSNLHYFPSFWEGLSLRLHPRRIQQRRQRIISLPFGKGFH